MSTGASPSKVSLSAGNIMKDAGVTSLVPTAEMQPTMKIEAVAKAFGISRASGYEAARIGDIPTIELGRRKVVATAWVRRKLQLDEPGSNGIEIIDRAS